MMVMNDDDKDTEEEEEKEEAGRQAGSPPSSHLLSIHPVHAGCLEHRVMRLPAGVQNAIWKVLPPNKDAVQVALCAAVGNVSPVLLLTDLPQTGKPVEHTNLRLVQQGRVNRKNRGCMLVCVGLCVWVWVGWGVVWQQRCTRKTQSRQRHNTPHGLCRQWRWPGIVVKAAAGSTIRQQV